MTIKGRQRVLLSREGREYRQTAIDALRARSQAVEAFAGPVAVSIDALPPDNRRRDLDNTLKAALDALTAAGVWADDSQIVDLRIVRGAVVAGGRLRVTVEAL